MPGSLCAPPLLLIVTPGANCRVDDVLPDRFGLTGFLAQPSSGPSADVPLLLDGEATSEEPVAVGPVEVSPDDELAEVDAEESEAAPVVSAAATPWPEASAATSHPVTTTPL
ncbi:hypothetical protein QQ25_01260 [Mycolicibacterium setense]|nr:hypothetical protein QQ25_01260 [Mycolicibacterium setense]